jgi:hypothetical protein
MSSPSPSTDNTNSLKSPSASSKDLPAEVAGWCNQSPNSEYPLCYWKAGSTHVSGSYEQLAAAPRDDAFELINRSFDQFGHLLSTTTVSRTRTDFGVLFDKAIEYMERFPSSSEFVSKPSIPTTIGEWELTTVATEPPRNVTSWELEFGAAEFSLEQTGIESHYSYTHRPHTIRYREPDTDTIEIVADIPRTKAFEIAVYSLKKLEAPVTSSLHPRERLQEIRGIGRKKSRDLLLLGMDSPSVLTEHLQTDTPIVNSSHEKAVERLLTGMIRSDLIN